MKALAHTPAPAASSTRTAKRAAPPKTGEFVPVREAQLRAATTVVERVGTFAPASVTRALLADSVERRMAILNAADMLTTDQSAELVGMTRVGIVDRIRRGAAIGLIGPKRGFKLPKWQFEPQMWQVLPRVIRALGTVEGWAIYSFMETPHGALSGLTPRRALEQGRVDEVLGLAAAHGT